MDLNGQELVKLIKACRDAGVTELKLGELEVKFKNQEILEEEETTPSHWQAYAAPKPHMQSVQQMSEQTEEVQFKTPQSVQREFDEIEESILLMEDPAEWERLQIERSNQ